MICRGSSKSWEGVRGCPIFSGEQSFSELYAMGSVQSSFPRGVAENRGHCVDLLRRRKQQSTEFTKLSSVRTPEID